MKRDKYDNVFSKLVRRLAGFRCEKCGKQYPSNSQGLHCSHHFSRRNKATRWDLDNAAALCYSCHQWFGENPVAAYDWLKSYIGEEKLDQLRLKANSVKKWTPEDKDLLYKEMRLKLEELETVNEARDG